MTKKHFLKIGDDGYLLGVYSLPDGVTQRENPPFVETLDGLNLEGYRIKAHRWDGEKLVLDEDRLAELEAEEAAKKVSAISPVDRMEAQVYYTAMMTDTLMEV